MRSNVVIRSLSLKRKSNKKRIWQILELWRWKERNREHRMNREEKMKEPCPADRTVGIPPTTANHRWHQYLSRLPQHNMDKRWTKSCYVIKSPKTPSPPLVEMNCVMLKKPEKVTNWTPEAEGRPTMKEETCWRCEKLPAREKKPKLAWKPGDVWSNEDKPH